MLPPHNAFFCAHSCSLLDFSFIEDVVLDVTSNKVTKLCKQFLKHIDYLPF